MRNTPARSAAIAALALVCSAGLVACDGPANDSGRAAIETRIVPAITIAGDDYSSYDLEARLVAYDVPAASIAVVRNGRIAWAAAYGGEADTGTLFQAASLSKAVAAAGILALARERGFDIDADLTGQLGGFDLTAVNPDARPVSLRALLSHTAGATSHGFFGYAAGAPIPDTLQVVTGSEPSNSPQVEIRFDPDNPWRYSGGGFEIAQLWAEQASGEDFAALMQRLVLDPVGMDASSFAVRLHDDQPESEIARGYGYDGEPVEGGWRIHPELAAAGLWTTPSDYARFLIALMAAADGETGRGIEPQIARLMTTAIANGYGLGIGTSLRMGERRLEHGGGNEGYRCTQFALPERGDAMVIMTNGNNAGNLLADITRTAELAYDWPHEPARTEARLELGEAELTAFTGDYAADGEEGAVLHLEVWDRDLLGVFYGQIHFRLVPIGVNRFIDPVDGEVFTFTEASGMMVASDGSHDFTRLPGRH